MDDPSLQIDYLSAENSQRVGEDVIVGLTQIPKTLPPLYFYDQLGSELFDRICTLPEYYPTRTETAILEQYASEIAQWTGKCQLVELGSGSSLKTRLLLSAYNHLAGYVPIDISASALENSVRELRRDYPNLPIHGLVGTYELALEWLKIHPVETRLLVFLGSTLGNFSPPQCDRFFTQVMTTLQSGDYFLLGIDLQKPLSILEAAYNDSQGVTAAFNLNMLSHLNWRYDGNFNLDLFEHRAFYNLSHHQIEMHLLAKQSQQVTLAKLNLTVNFTAGETILTEISRKFALERQLDYLLARGLKPLHTWTDNHQWFGLILCQVF